jgi:tRNA-dihydrouridine synthase 4
MVNRHYWITCFSIASSQGCPQPWAYSSGIGSALLRKPELVADMVRAVKDRMGWEYGVSVKIRVDGDLR